MTDNTIMVVAEEPASLIPIGTVMFSQGESEKTISIVAEGQPKTLLVKSKRQKVTVYSTKDPRELTLKDISESLVYFESGPLVSAASNLREFVVTACEHSHLDSLYHDLEHEGCGEFDHCPHRACECLQRLPTSRNTHYLLSDDEAERLKQDPRVRDVSLTAAELGLVPAPVWTQTSSNWNKSSLSTTNSMVNWGLLSGTNPAPTPYGQDTQIPDTGTVALDPVTGVISGTPAGRWRSSNSGTLIQEVRVAVKDSSVPPKTAQNIGVFWLATYSPGHLTGVPNTAGIEVTRGSTVNYTHSVLSGGTPPYNPETLSYWRKPYAFLGPTGYETSATSISGTLNFECDEELWLTAVDSSSPRVQNPNTAVFRVKVNPQPTDKTFTITPSYYNWRMPLDLGTLPKNSTSPVESAEITLSPVNTTFSEIYVDCYMMFPSGPDLALNEGMWSYSLTSNGNDYKLKIIANPSGFTPGTYMGLVIVSAPGRSAWDSTKVSKSIYCKVTIAGSVGEITATPAKDLFSGERYPWQKSYNGLLDMKLISNTAMTPFQTFTSVTGGTPPYTHSFYGTKGWGLNGKELNTSGTATTKTSGKNVDVLIIDEGGVPDAHPEFAVNSDGTGGSRVKSTPIDIAAHSTHVTSTVAGNTQGWARDANIYNMQYSDFVFRSARSWHNNKPINPITGRKNPTVCNNSWRYLDTDVYLTPLDSSRLKIASVNYRGVTYINPSNGTSRPFGLVKPGSTASNSWAHYPKIDVGFQGALNLPLNRTGGVATLWVPYLPGAASAVGTPRIGQFNFTGSTTPTVGDNTDGYWTLTLPWPIKIWDPTLFSSYNRPPIITSTIWVSTKGYISFQAPPSSPGAGKTISELPGVSLAIHMGNNSCQRIFFGAYTSEKWQFSQAFKIRWEGHTEPTGGALGSPTLAWEVTFYKPTVFSADSGYPQDEEQLWFDVVVHRNALFDGGWKLTDLNKWGITFPDQFLGARSSAIDADVEDCINDGMIMVGAAANETLPMCSETDPDYNNSFVWMDFGNLTSRTVYYMRGASPTSKCITVGALGNNSENRRADFSNYGSGVDIWAPGEAIMGAFTNTAYRTNAVADSRSGNFYLNKLAGTSMASPQVAGLLALALDTNPRMNQSAALAYLQQHGLANVYNTPINQVDAETTYTDIGSLHGSSAKSAFYHNDRPNTGTVTPVNTLNARPARGQAYPRNRIYRYGKRV